MSELSSEELSRLSRFLQAHDTRFALALVRIPRFADREQLGSWVEQFIGTLNRKCVRINGSDLKPLELWARLTEPVTTGSVVLLDGLDEAFREENGEVLSILNQQRERLAEALPGPVLLLLGDSVLDRFLAGAPDLADWHAATFDFRTEAASPDLQGVHFDASPTLSRELVDSHIALLKEQLQNTTSDEVRVRIADDIANSCKDQGRYQESYEFASMAMEAARRSGADDLKVAVYRTRLALTLANLGEYDAAQEQAEQALKATSNVLGYHHHQSARQRAVLARILMDRGEYEDARKHIEDAIESGVKEFGPDDNKVASRRTVLSSLLQRMGEHVEARRQAELALESGLRNLGPDSSEVAIRRSNLAIILSDLEAHQEARKQLDLALESDLRRLGTDHPSLGVCRGNLAVVLSRLGDHAEALKQADLALALFQGSLPPDHPYIQDTLKTIAILKAAQ